MGSLHLADVNTAEIPYLIHRKAVPKNIDASLFSMIAHLDYSLFSEQMNGDVHISKIGRNQARSFFDIIDPNKESPNINTARLGLNIGYPNAIRIPIRNGLMDINLDIRSLGIPFPFRM